MWRCLVLSLACAGCTNPDDILAVRGTVVSVDPVEGQVVRLLRHVSPQPNAFFVGDGCSQATPLKELRADAEGTFAFELFRVETRSADCFRVDVHFPSGSTAWSDLSFYGPETQLRPLRDWRAAPWLDGGVLQFTPPVPWPDELPPGASGEGIQLTHREQLFTLDGGLAWQAEDRFHDPDASSNLWDCSQCIRGPLVLDALRLEDFEAILSLSAHLYEPDEDAAIFSGGQIPTRMTAGERLTLRGTRVPLSRGLGCPELATPCPLTDGELTEVDAGMIGEVSLNLAAPSNVSAAVIRGAWIADDLIRVVLSQDDGGIAGEFEGALPKPDWSAFGPAGVRGVWRPDAGFIQVKLTYLLIPLDAGVPVSRVTLQFPSGLAGIQEVSVFE